jgi:hypothetical protein
MRLEHMMLQAFPLLIHLSNYPLVIRILQVKTEPFTKSSGMGFPKEVKLRLKLRKLWTWE